MSAYNALSVRGLNVRYQNKKVLEEINLDLPQEKFAAIIGPNGAGKTTLLNAALQLIKSESGTFRYFSGSLAEKRPTIAYVPQRANVDWDFPISVFEVVLMGRLTHLKWWQRPNNNDKKMAHQALEQVDMESYANNAISELSGGQQQRVFIARALAQKATLYLLDEPFSAIDIASEQAIYQQLKLLQNNGATLLCVHHDLNTVEQYFDYLFLLNKHLVAQGPVAKVFTEQYIKKTYSNPFSLLAKVEVQDEL